MKFKVITPVITVGNIPKNADNIISYLDNIAHNTVVIFQKYALTGATFGSLVDNNFVIKSAHNAIRKIAEKVGNFTVIFGGLNSFFVIKNHKIVAQQRYDADGLNYENLYITSNITYAPNSINIILAETGANALAPNLNFHNSTIFVSPSIGESSTDNLFTGRVIATSQGVVTLDMEQTEFADKVYDFDLDLKDGGIKTTAVAIDEKYPFVPSDLGKALGYQALALVTRLKSIHCERVILGVSGGLDSTLALLVCVRAMKLLQYDVKNILGVTMPGFGTSGRTKNNADDLMELLGIRHKTISIETACSKHLEDIGHNGCPDVAYENAQARERTQILFDLANMENAIVVGTGDMSEIALGWCTYGGDHIAHYNVNCGIPKTVVQRLVSHESQVYGGKIGEILADIVATPISPELLPGKQLTENIVGDYYLNDYFLYGILNGNSPSNILENAVITFNLDGKYVAAALKIFLRRFITQQFKRSCATDGPAILGYSLSPRNGLKLASDCDFQMWLADVENGVNTEYTGDLSDICE